MDFDNSWNTLQPDSFEFNIADGANQLQDQFSNFGYNGPIFNDPEITGYGGESGNTPEMGPAWANQGLLDFLKNNNYSLQSQNQGNTTYTRMADANNKTMGNVSSFVDSPNWFEQLMPMAIGAVTTGGLGGGLSGLFGGGLGGNALGYGLASGTVTDLQGGDFKKGFTGGAVGGGMNALAKAGTSIAGSLGIENPMLRNMVNRAGSSALSTLASGGDGSDVLQSGLTGGALAGANIAGKAGMDFIKNAFSNLSTDVGGLEDLMGSGGDMSGQTDVSPNRYAEFNTGSDGLETYNPSYMFNTGEVPQQQPLSANNNSQGGFSLGSLMSGGMSGLGSSIGNFVGNNAGDLASMLYGFYNNRRQQKALGSQINNVNQATTSLQNMYGQNSPYAIQLRNKLNAQAAASGRRSNLAGRETQFQAMLADKAASTLPQIAQMQNSLLQANQARGGLQNNNMNILLQGFNKMGGFNSLGKLFQQNPMAGYSMSGNTSDYNTLGMEGHY